MAAVTIQLGQCGNQVGEAFLDSLFSRVATSEDLAPPLNLLQSNPNMQTLQQNNNMKAQKKSGPHDQYGSGSRLSSDIVSFFSRPADRSREVDVYFREMANGNARCGENFQDITPNSNHVIPRAYVARAVLVDMEPRVIQKCLARHPLRSTKSSGEISGIPAHESNNSDPNNPFHRGNLKRFQQSDNSTPKTTTWAYDPLSSFHRQSGSGNNWSCGYSYGKLYAEQISDVIRREVELCDRLNGFVCLFSVAGGTGSGLGSATLELLAEEYGGKSVECPWESDTADDHSKCGERYSGSVNGCRSGRTNPLHQTTAEEEDAATAEEGGCGKKLPSKDFKDSMKVLNCRHPQTRKSLRNKTQPHIQSTNKTGCSPRSPSRKPDEDRDEWGSSDENENGTSTVGRSIYPWEATSCTSNTTLSLSNANGGTYMSDTAPPSRVTPPQTTTAHSPPALSCGILVGCVWPLKSGEVSVQAYNSVLSLNHAYQYSDLVFLLENEQYALIESSSKAGSSGLSHGSLKLSRPIEGLQVTS
jgi:hypothetical protein